MAAGYEKARHFAIELGIEEARYTRWERAETEPNFEMLLLICQSLGITPNQLLIGAKRKKKLVAAE